VEVEEREEEGVRCTNIPYTILSLSLLICCLSLGIDYEIRSKMLDYWVGLGFTVFQHRIIPSRWRLFMVWFGSGVREEDCTIYKCRELLAASCNKGMLGCWGGEMGNRKGWNGMMGWDMKVWGYIILYLYLYDMREREREREKSDLHLTVSK
jgi:hypothetical protein